MTESNGSVPHEGSMPDWEKRFRAPRVSLPDWAEDAPHRSLFVSNATGTYELYAWDRETGDQRQVTDRPNGTTDGVMSPDGKWIWWFDDKDGDEFGIWRRQPFAGSGGKRGEGGEGGRTAHPFPTSPRLPGSTPPIPLGSRSAGTGGRRSSAGRPTRTARRSMSAAPARTPSRSTGTASRRVSAISRTTDR